MARRAWRIAVPLFAAACSRADAPTPTVGGDFSELTTSPSPVTPSELRDASVDAAVDRSLGNFQLTFYYVADEAEVAASPSRAIRPSKRVARAAKPAARPAAGATDAVDAADAGVPAVASGADVDAGSGDDTTLAAAIPDLVPVYDRTCNTLGNVSRAFFAQLAMQGTGRLRDGRVLNVAGPCTCPRTPCFHVLPSHRKWGMGGGGQPLEPFRTVAVDPRKVKLGSLLYVPALDGVRMPGPRGVGGFVHDGCVVAGDTGGGVQGAQIDLFVARRAYYRGLARRGGSHGWARSVEVRDGTYRCQRRGGQVSRSAAGSI